MTHLEYGMMRLSHMLVIDVRNDMWIEFIVTLDSKGKPENDTLKPIIFVLLYTSILESF